jgi:hypothetical protein
MKLLTAVYYTRILCCFRNSACKVWSLWGTSCRTSDHFLVRSCNITTDISTSKQTHLLNNLLSAYKEQPATLKSTESHLTSILPLYILLSISYLQLSIPGGTTSWRHISRVEVRFHTFSTLALDGQWSTSRPDHEYGVWHSQVGHCGHKKNQTRMRNGIIKPAAQTLHWLVCGTQYKILH